MEALEQDIHGDSRALYSQIQRREYLNVRLMMPRGDPKLEVETEITAKMLFDNTHRCFVCRSAAPSP
jgi:hypothetical protein